MNNIPVAGVDVSKYFSDMCILSPDNTVFRTVKVYHDYVSMERSLSFLEETETAFGVKPVIIMEATGHYHRILFQFYHNHGYETIVINPIQSGALKNIAIRKIKNDKIDAHRIALFYRLNTAKISSVPSDKLLCLRSLCRQHFDMKQDITSYTNRLISYLDQTFPGFCKVFGKITSRGALAVLSQYPSPYDISSAEEQDLISLIQHSSNKSRSFAEDKTAVLKQTAADAVNVTVTAISSPVLIQGTVAVLNSLINGVKAIDDEINALIKSDIFLTEQTELLKSIPGISDFSAAVILEEIGDFSMFAKPKQLVAFCGLDPAERQSGNFKSISTKLSKRGSPYLRKILHMAARVNISPARNGIYLNPVMYEYYHRKREQKPYKSVMCAVMHKLVNIIFAVMRDQKPFELRTPEEHIQRMTSLQKAA